MKPAKAKFGFSTTDKYISFEITVKLSTEFKFFFSIDELPETLRSLPSAPHGPRVYKDSFYGLSQVIENLINDYECSLVEETKEKVILYYLDAEDGISFKWCTVQKVVISDLKGKKAVSYYTERREHRGYTSGTSLTELSYSYFGDKFYEMAWTPAREAWFESMEEKIESLAKQLRSGFSKTPEVLARAIDQGAQFLLTASPEPQQSEQATAYTGKSKRRTPSA